MNWYKKYIIAAYGDIVKNKYLQQDIPEDTIDSYLHDFNKFRTQKLKELYAALPVSVPKENRNDISYYDNWKDLETVVDYIRAQLKPKDYNKSLDTEVQPIFENNDIAIYKGDNASECISIKGNSDVSWCTCASDSNNMYNSYRYQTNEPTFYFVKDKNNSCEDPINNFLAIQKTNDDSYVVTNMDNDGDYPMSWDDILQLQPKLNGLEEYFKHIPISKKEREFYNKVRKNVEIQEFIKMTYQEKEMFLDMVGEFIDDKKFFYLPEELKSRHIGKGNLSCNQFRIIKDNKQLVKRFINRITDESRYNLLEEDTPDKKEIANILGKAEINKLSDEDIFNLLNFTIDKKEMCDIIIQYKGNNLTDKNISALLKYAPNKEEMCHIIIRYKGNNLTNNIFELLYYAPDKKEMASILGQENINKLSDYNVFYLLKNSPDKKEMTNILGQENINKLSNYLDYMINEKYLNDEMFELCDNEQKKRYIDSTINKGYYYNSDKIFELCDNELKKYYIDAKIKNKHKLNPLQQEYYNSMNKKVEASNNNRLWNSYFNNNYIGKL